MKTIVLYLQALIMAAQAKLGIFQACRDIDNVNGGFSTSYMDSWWYTVYQDGGNWNTECPIQRLEYDSTSGIFDIQYAYRSFWLFKTEMWAIARCNTVDGKCFVNWWGWLNGNTDGTTNW